MSDIIDFYGAKNRSIFAIEREAMDRAGIVTAYLRSHLPRGLILDIGAGDGYTANKLSDREVICLEPAGGMVNFANNRIWVKGSAESLPFHDDYFDGAYATWAYFLPSVDKSKGLDEALRVVKPDGTILIVDNAGDDEFCSLASTPIHEGPEFYLDHGFSKEILETAFEFSSLEDAYQLMKLYFPDRITKDIIKLRYEYKVVVYRKTL